MALWVLFFLIATIMDFTLIKAVEPNQVVLILYSAFIATFGTVLLCGAIAFLLFAVCCINWVFDGQFRLDDPDSDPFG